MNLFGKRFFDRTQVHGWIWRVLALSILFGAAYLNEKFNIRNPELEQKLLGCWGIAGEGPVLAGAVVMQVSQDGSFRETGILQLSKVPAADTSYVSNGGNWYVEKDEWVLKYTESSSDSPLGYRRGTLRLKVISATDRAIEVKDRLGFRVTYIRLPQTGGGCRASA